MPKSGQARVPSTGEWQRVFEVIQDHRHPEKNTAIMQISAKLGLRAQEIALLQIKEVARLKKSPPGFTLYKVMSLPAAYTKGANAMGRSSPQYTRRTVSFSVETFDQVVAQIVDLAQAGVEVDPKRFYPAVRKRAGQSRDLPLVDEDLREALTNYLALRLDKHPGAKPTDPLFITQKGVPYSPNTLQEHMALILRGWAGIEKATSHSGRRSVITDIIHKQKKSLKVAQKVAGHKSASTTVI
ncbi:MAG: tyrosine-type recombinase/integrase, partial [Pseudomonadales bacterium]|nr:tyrosine-type recombinase/integrase [Pseudomonadales bacterium]